MKTYNLFTLDNVFIKNSNDVPWDFTGIVRAGKKGEWWYLNGKFHREIGPACVWNNGLKEWRRLGKLHRIDGPAVEITNSIKEFWINDEKLQLPENVTKESFKLYVDLLKLKGVL